MDDSRKRDIEEKRKAHKEAVTYASEKLRDLEHKGVKFNKVAKKLSDESEEIEDDVQMLLAKDLIAQADAIKTTNPKRYHELIQEARDILEPKTTKQEKDQLKKYLDDILNKKVQAGQDRAARLAEMKAKFREVMDKTEGLIAEKNYDEAERVYGEAKAIAEGYPEETAIVEVKIKALRRKRFQSKMEEGNKLADEKKYNEAGKAYDDAKALANGIEEEVAAVDAKIKELREKRFKERMEEGRRLTAERKFDEALKAFGDARSAAAGNPEESELVENEVKETQHRKAFAELDRDIEQFHKTNIFISQSETRNVLRMVQESPPPSEDPESIETLSEDLKSKIKETEETLARFIDTAKADDAKKASVKKKLLDEYNIRDRIAEINDIGSRMGEKDISKNTYPRLIKILRRFERLVEQS